MSYDTFDTRVFGIDVDAAVAALLVFLTVIFAYLAVASPWTVRGIIAGHAAFVSALMAWSVCRAISASSNGGNEDV